MSYEILRTTEGLIILHITAANLHSLTGWRIEFHNGQEAMLYYCSGEWVQHDEQWLDGASLRAIGNCIDDSQMKRNTVVAERYSYNNVN